jgi:O-antigen/teichoic acid export membrane protein
VNYHHLHDAIVKHIPHSGGFARNVAVLAGGTALGQGLVVVFAPLLSRLYSPADFGNLAIYSSVLSVLSVVVSLKYELAIPLPKEDSSAYSLMALSMLLAFVTTACVAGLMWGFGPSVVAWAGLPSFEGYLWLVPLGLFGTAIYQTLSYWSVRKKAFETIARTKVRQNVGMVSVQLVTAFLAHGALGLLVGDIAGRFLGSGTLAGGLELEQARKTHWRDVRSVARTYARFPEVMLWAGLSNILAMQIPFFLLPKFFLLEKVGMYFFAYRILALPVTLLSAAVSQVFFAEIAQASDSQKMRETTQSVADLLLTIGLPLYLGLLVIGPRAFSLFFGVVWTGAGQYAVWLAPMLILRLVGSSLSSLLTVGGRYAEALFFTVVELCTSIVCIWIATVYNSIEAFLISSMVFSIPLGVLSIWRFVRVAQLRTLRLLYDALFPIAPINIFGFMLIWLGVVIFPPVPSIVIWLLVVFWVLYASLRMPHLRTTLSRL